MVDSCTDSEDTGSLEAYNIFKSYLALYEDVLEKFQREEGLSPADIKKKLERVLESNLIAKFMVKYMLMALEFEAFMDFCKDYVKSHERPVSESKSSSK